MIISQLEYDNFRRDGWVLVEGFLGREESAQFRAWADELERYQGEDCLRYYEASADGGRVLSRMENFFASGHGPDFLFGESLQFVEILSAVLGDEPSLFKDKINFKPAGGGAYKVHQDAPAYTGFGISFFVTAMIAIDDATLANGCLEFATGTRITRELGLDANGDILTSELNGITFEPVPIRSGDLIVFDGLVPHRSKRNESRTPRRAVFLTFNRKKEGDERSRYYDMKKQFFPPENQRVPGLDYQRLGKQFNLGNPFV
jgi:hypothetical protein